RGGAGGALGGRPRPVARDAGAGAPARPAGGARVADRRAAAVGLGRSRLQHEGAGARAAHPARAGRALAAGAAGRPPPARVLQPLLAALPGQAHGRAGQDRGRHHRPRRVHPLRHRRPGAVVPAARAGGGRRARRPRPDADLARLRAAGGGALLHLGRAGGLRSAGPPPPGRLPDPDRPEAMTGAARGEVLIVDDERSIRELLLLFLGRAGYAVEAAASGAEARRAMAAKEHDVVITDLQMPDATGLDVLGESKASHPETQVIIVTAYA